jgi:hypothetical protein
MDDPQMLAELFFLLGLYVYIRFPANGRIAFAVALLFVVGGNIKHNPLAAPMAVFVDLLLLSRLKAAGFAFWGIALTAASVAMTVWFVSPSFIAHILEPRQSDNSHFYYFVKLFAEHTAVPLLLAGAWAIWHLRSSQYRIVALYFLASILIGAVLSRGAGTNVNMFFDTLFALSIIWGLLLHYGWSQTARSYSGWVWRLVLPALLISGLWRFDTIDREGLRAQQSRFEAEVAFLSAQPGQAICESPLRCFNAGKPFVYDPFNATSLVDLKMLNVDPMVQKIASKSFGAIQTSGPVTGFYRPHEHFPDAILDAIDRYYRISFKDQDVVIYVPR